MSIIRGWRRFDRKYLIPFFIRDPTPQVSRSSILTVQIAAFLFYIWIVPLTCNIQLDLSGPPLTFCIVKAHI